MGWPDVELVVGTGLRGTIAGRVVTVLPTKLESLLPVTRVTRGPGPDDGITDAPLVDVETFAATRGAMWELAEDTRQAMLALAGRAAAGALVDTVATVTGPTWVDYENPAVQRAVATYRLQLRQLPPVEDDDDGDDGDPA